MASEADIANLALGRLRVGQSITSLDEQSTSARIISRYYDQCRQEVLRSFPWGCSLKAETLAEVAGQTFPGWEYVYQYPTGCLNIRCVSDESGMRTAMSYLTYGNYDGLTTFVQRSPWQLALKDDNASQVILSDVPDAWVFYTYNLDTVGVFPSDLVSSIAWRIAMEVGGPLKADAGMIDRAEQRYILSISQAAAQNMNESREDYQPDSPSIQVRY